MLIGYSRPDRRFSAEAQKTLLLKAGVEERRIWVEADRGGNSEYEEMSFLISPNKGLRSGDTLVVAWFHRLAATRRDLQLHIRGITTKKATILEASSGRSSADPADFSEMVFEASNFYAGKSMTRLAATALGNAGADASPVTKKKKGMMPKADALKIWRDPQYLREQALAVINADERYKVEWTPSRAYRELGPRGVPAGRRPLDWVRAAKLPRARPEPKGLVYFLRAGGKGDVKIGFTTDVKGRIGSMKTGHPGELAVLATIGGTHADEQDLHRRFANYRRKGEWFSYTGVVRKFIEALPTFIAPKPGKKMKLRKGDQDADG